eukprot:6195415-Pleurochrysis_carterae.AAC.3
MHSKAFKLASRVDRRLLKGRDVLGWAADEAAGDRVTPMGQNSRTRAESFNDDRCSTEEWTYKPFAPQEGVETILEKQSPN